MGDAKSLFKNYQALRKCKVLLKDAKKVIKTRTTIKFLFVVDSVVQKFRIIIPPAIGVCIIPEPNAIPPFKSLDI